MYCPQCGQEQVSSEMRFCSRCGFPLGGVTELLARGGVSQLQAEVEPRQGRELSQQQKGTRQGVMMMCSAFLIVPIVSLLSVFIVGGEHLLIPIAAILTFVGGLLRIVYSRLYEDDTPGARLDAPARPLAAPAQLDSRPRFSALPAQQGAPVPSFAPRRRLNTAELAQPPSVTENTTRLLDEDKAARGE